MTAGAWKTLALCVASCLAAGCGARVTTPTTLKTVPIEKKNTHSAQTSIPMSSDGFLAGDMDAETVISTECVAAWRRELKGDTKGALKQLEDLNTKYPRMTTIAMMQGQICEHAGRKEEAVKFYRAAVRGSEFSTLHQFKLAQALRKAGKSKEAEDSYRKVVKAAPDFTPGKLGLARALFEQDQKSAEAVQLVDDVLTAHPEDQEAKALAAELKAGK